jgi:small subunit ribosomal protein S7
MPRRRVPKKRQTPKDPIFHSEIVGSFINDVMRGGKKSIAYKIVYGAVDLVREHFIKENRVSEEFFQKIVDEKRQLLGLSEKEPLPDNKIGLVVLYRSIDNARPHVEVRSSRVGGDTRQVPRALTSQRGQRLARNFIRKAALARRGSTAFKPGDKGMIKLLALELIDAYDGKGAAVKMCTDMHRMAKANQAYVYTRPSATQEALSI